ncbi:charged multivesicular body protein 7-like [Homarus americanus]|uniref:Charged multivesicular body protein 7-like n=1 Tax=Homarus americanus TaxID=6706 RepID=A0A8J5JWT2_HOMAM|nr:charged multivesicular body protein 7-like [Homarus americanus]XP_042236452.1 charged multivesicular body protein 7-like [Homarus americanus]XP_042236453.1 charged multivesicular body protein 7-like [Homarus americanus]XP_042236454.1 charged multivesicular body protein 7-like [Homarus americanus]KAG7160794.1 Charged multivesicular body protein 7-like [Homarus americanus]
MDTFRDYLPPEWNNEERMRVLLGPMPVAQDTVARTARCTFWSAAIHHWCRMTHKLTFTLLECQNAFRRGTQTPLSLPDVLLHMNRLGDILPLDQLPAEPTPESWISWGHRVFVAKPSHFAWNQLKQVIGTNNLQGTLVNTILLQNMCDGVMKRYWELSSGVKYTSKLVSLAELYNHFGVCVGSPENLNLVVETLVKCGRAATVIHNGTLYVKFAMLGDTSKPTITQTELAEYDLQCAQQRVQDNVAQLGDEMTKLQLEAKCALQAGFRIKALSMLRRKKRVEKSLATQLGALENVTTCLHQLQDAAISKQVLGAFQVGVEALRAMMIGDASADAAAITMDDLQQVLDECQEVSSVLGAGVISPEAEDDDVLQAELNQLVAQHQDSQQLDQQLANKMEDLRLPDVPKTNPLTSMGTPPEKMT